ncbi:acyltransferase [Fictibacillus macauensis ZFHKF-1]|uniref:Acyltransferase n=1 Tax=Fictibacillus macauensis ZFHKF-1 TaxID=1196324 RepID=I8UBP9_9BACL|nr:acyltransferase family protein [Fictibacillus macauensis]EIT84223.1 acyltransferase [Fictibacillus macauensis ZFHKF-1]
MRTVNSKDLKISNMKGLLIFLVVFGHLIEVYKSTYYNVFVFIYSFHMPLFILISGYLAKNVKGKKILNLLLLYVVFQAFFNFLVYVIGVEKTLQWGYEKPQFHLWYIVSLCVWYALAYGLKRISHALLVVAVVSCVVLVAVASRYYAHDVVSMLKTVDPEMSTYTLSYQRTLSFAPFFLVGFFITRERLQRLYVSFHRVGYITCGAVIVWLLLYIQKNPHLEQLFRGSYGAHRFMGHGDGYLEKMFLHYGVAFLLSWLLLKSVTSRRSWLTTWGDHSLTIFLFHPIFVFILQANPSWLQSVQKDTRLILLGMGAMLISALLASKALNRLVSRIIAPYETLLVVYQVMRAIFSRKTEGAIR